MELLGYRIDAVHRTVTSPSGRVTRLEPKAFDLLSYFTAHPEETLAREQLIADVWGGKFVTDDAVMVAVYALRQAFDDDSKAPKFIETIRGRGYRWIAKATSPASPASPASPTSPVGGQAPSPVRAAVALFAVCGVAAVVWAIGRDHPMPTMQRTSALVRAHARGMFFSERTTRKDLELARTEFREAIRLDDRFAEPHAALAEACVRLIEVGSPEVEANEREARAEVAKAIELAPRLAFTQAALASVQFVLDRDTEKAERSFRYAIDLDPTLPDSHRRYSYLLGATGRFATAIEQARIGAEMAPTSAGAINDLAWAYLLGGDTANAERLYREALQLDPANAGTLLSLGYCLETRNQPAEAMKSYRRALELRGAPVNVLTKYDALFATGGLPAVYAAWADLFKTRQDAPRFLVAMYSARAGRTAEAIEQLRESVRRRETGTLWLAVHPAFASLRGQREFATLAAAALR